MSTDGEPAGGMEGVRHIILVLSGKGGVGKSTVAVQLALALKSLGKRVGILDVDLCGPSVPRLTGLEGRTVVNTENGWAPVVADPEQRLLVMSIGFLLPNRDDAVIWRGPKKTSLIKQFIDDVSWGTLDYLVIDTPPGTSDEHISTVEALRGYNPDGAVIVTTPQAVSVLDVRKEISFCRKIGLPILGVFENMSGFVCPCCSEVTNIFSTGGGETMARDLGIPFLGRIPLDPKLAVAEDAGKIFMEVSPNAPTLRPLVEFARARVESDGRVEPMHTS